MVLKVVMSVEETKEKNASEVLVLKEYLDVFTKDLLGLSLDREIKFTINLILGREPISIPLYQMVLAKLKELKEPL